MSFECDSFNREFVSWLSCKQHMTAVDHWIWPHECDTCSSRFKTQRAAEQHTNDKKHGNFPYDCETCTISFRFEHARDQHQANEGQYSSLHCSDCDRYFRSPDNLAQHLRSRLHQGRNVICPFCQGPFTTASGLSHHLETSSCPQARHLDSAAIHRALRQRDPNGVITENLLEWHETSIDATWHPESAWNGFAYECYICRRQFNTARALNQHVRSPTHQAPLYHCPNKNSKCNGRRFPTLAALFNHLESESCGFVKFTAVQKNVRGFLTGRGQNLIAF